MRLPWITALFVVAAASIATAAPAAKPAAPKGTGSAPTPAAPRKAPTSGATVDKVLAYFHTIDFLDDLDVHLRDAVQRRQKETGLDAAMAKRMVDLGGRIYRKKNLYDVFKLAYAKATTLETMQTLFDFQNSPRGILLRQGFDSAYEIGREPAWKALLNKEKKSVNANRQNALTTFSTAFDGSDLQIDKKLGTDLAVALAANSVATPGQKETLIGLRERIQERRRGYIEAAQSYDRNFDYAVVHAMKNEEIDEVSKFCSTAAGQAATKAYRTALETTLDGAAKTLLAEIIKGTK